MIKIIADENIPYVAEVFEHFGEVVTMAGRNITPETLGDAECLLVRSITKVNENLLKGSKIRFVATATIGFDHIDTAYLAKKGIGFSSAPGSNATSVAEFVISSLLNLSAKYSFKLSDKSIGIVGVGNVGSRVAARCRALGMKVLLNDPPLFEKSGDENYRPIESLYDCDILTFHTPLTKEGKHQTKHLINSEFLAKTKPGLILFNTSRGSVGNTEAILEAIKSGHISSAVFDVWEKEPEISAELHAVTDIATPHIAGYSFDGKVRGTEMIYRAAAAFFDIESQWRLELPPPIVPEITLSKKYGSSEEALREIALKVYDVMEDDQRMRKMAYEPTETRGKFFDRLRKEYPVRREFANTHVVLQKKDEALTQLLEAMDFSVSD
ncbi:MAG: 4-phosphoerythronate dehydrogenase PdxB [Fibrobacteres bacterium]|nr:4-phosphoerythronate dehydrogenase PdxB [Fibrobacterota bacterium]